jgi:hypothetical protein
MNDTLNPAYWALRLTYGLVPLLAGLDKFFGLLADWESYLSPAVAALLPVSPGAFMMAVGVIEMAVGLAVLTRFTRLGALVAAAWLVLIALNLIAAGILDVAVRDLAMAVGAFTLARLEAVRAAAPGRAGARSRAEAVA